MCDVHADFSNEEVRTARKGYACEGCGKPIPAGSRYVAISGKWDGEVYTVREHEECLALTKALKDADGCWVYTHLSEVADYASQLTPEQAERIKALTGYEAEVRP